MYLTIKLHTFSAVNIVFLAQFFFAYPKFDLKYLLNYGSKWNQKYIGL